jgi:dihydroflavonol-4-reductase
MTTVLVTGATGLVGGNVCRLLISDGITVRGLVRSAGDASPLEALGVELRQGDIVDAASVAAAAEGCDAIIHTAAVLGGVNQDLDQQLATNTAGSSIVFDVAAERAQRVVLFSTIAAFDQEKTLTERSEIDDVSTDPYTRTKRAALQEAADRMAKGQDLIVVVPGSVYGPSPVISRALAPTSFNRLIRAAIRGRLVSYPSVDSLWVRAEDVAAVSVAALAKGDAGDRYLAVGAEDAIDSRGFFNLACSIANVNHRVQPVELDPDDPEVVATYGESMTRSFSIRRPVPAVDASWTRQRLQLQPLDMQSALTETVDWLRTNGQIS